MNCAEKLIYCPTSRVDNMPMTLGTFGESYFMVARSFMPVDNIEFGNAPDFPSVFSIYSSRLDKVVFTSMPVSDVIIIDLNTLLTIDPDTLTVSAVPQNSDKVTSVTPAMFVRAVDFRGVYILQDSTASQELVLTRIR